MSTIAQQSILRLECGLLHRQLDELAEEEPLEIRIRNCPVTVTMRTTGHDEELAAGFLLGEGVIRNRQDLVRIAPCGKDPDGNIMNVTPAPLVGLDLGHLSRDVYASSSCGVCGKRSINAVRRTFPPVEGGPVIDAAAMLALPEIMRRTQETFARTGGLHAAGLFDEMGNLLILREDIGRHNAVDKVLGRALLDGLLPLQRSILLVSSRASFEIMQKALSARVPVVAAVSAPSSLAAAFAQESGQTLVGFLREGRMNVYCHPERLRFSRGPRAACCA